MKNKIVIIGLDGVDFSLAEELIKRNIMPNLGKLSRNGARGNMLSCLPLHSSITWTTFITGKNAGKHGIFGFFVMDKDTHELKIANSLERKSQAIWHILNAYGKKVGISNLPSLYPPEKIDGYMICGMLTPSINSNFTYPKGLKDELLKNIKDFELDLSITMSSKNSKEMLLKKIYEITSKRTETAKFLLSTYPCDVNMFVFTETDRMLHLFLKDMDTDSQYKGAVEEYFRFLDNKIGEIIEMCDEDTTIFIVSDHGMKPFKKVFYVNNLLLEMGLLEGENKSARKTKYLFTAFCFQAIIELMVKLKISPEYFKRFLPESFFKRLNIIIGKGKGYNWSKTKAYFWGGLGDCIVINLKGRQPEGIVPPEEYEKIRDEIIDKIKSIKDPDTNEGIAYGIYKREDLFTGDFVKSAPDIIVKLREGYAPHESIELEGIFNKKSLFEPITSDHTRNATLIISGKNIKKGVLFDGSNILDIAPTVLSLLGVPVPSDMDGKVLAKILSEEVSPSFVAPGLNESERLRQRIKELKANGRLK
ncbi:MAG: alkaline phosphatase family protein [Candidatus Omnitrophota bacterium]|jgi:predicted AlkP superfamily phosphohydrolase/phosphomutase